MRGRFGALGFDDELSVRSLFLPSCPVAAGFLNASTSFFHLVISNFAVSENSSLHNDWTTRLVLFSYSYAGDTLKLRWICAEQIFVEEGIFKHSPDLCLVILLFANIYCYRLNHMLVMNTTILLCWSLLPRVQHRNLWQSVC